MKDKTERVEKITEFEIPKRTPGFRQVIIETNGNQIILVKSECSALELLSIFKELTKKIRKPLK